MNFEFEIDVITITNSHIGFVTDLDMRGAT